MESQDIVDKCRECGGKCCRGIIEVTPDDAFYAYNALTEALSGDIIRQMRVDEENRCICLVDGVCTRYDERPNICRAFKVGSECCEDFFHGRKTRHDCEPCVLYMESCEGKDYQGEDGETLTKDDMYMEDAVSISLAVNDVLEQELARYGVVLSEDELDRFYGPLLEFIEGFSNGNYRHEH
jgi:Fe-S-cluster containining protein